MYVDIPPYVTNQLVDAVDLNQIVANIGYVIYNASTQMIGGPEQLIPHNTWTKITGFSPTLDREAQWDAVNSQIVRARGGWYDISYNVEFAPNGVGAREARLGYYNGAVNTFFALTSVPGLVDVSGGQGLCGMFQAGGTTGDVIWLEVRQTSGGVLPVNRRIINCGWRTL